ncbi:hypothetical protein COJ69_19325 [Bacillus cereus]|nr:hypothetical protein COJ69_19325 [Bacillus cereus]
MCHFSSLSLHQLFLMFIVYTLVSLLCNLLINFFDLEKLPPIISFYNLIVTIFPRNGVSITILNFNLIIIE